MSNLPKINSSSVILISGGGRGVTAQCAIQLAQQYQCKFILLGRSSLVNPEPEWASNCFQKSDWKKRIMEALIAQGEKPTPVKVEKLFKTLSQSREIQQTLSSIQKLGGQAEYLSVDITNLSILKTSLELVVQRMGEITGIIHGAGNLADKLIENKTEQDFETVYTTKIEGLENLLACIPVNQLDILILFSSFVAFYGNPGQADYSLANEILNKFAHLLQRNYPTCHVVSIGWGPWDGGMVSPQLKNIFESKNIELISLKVGSKILTDELENTENATPQIIAMSSPIFPEPKLIISPNQTFRIHRKLTLEANPFVLDHVIGHRPVLPAMCAFSWLINTCEQLYPGYKFFSCENYRVLKGIVFDETLAQSYILDLHEVNKSIPGEIEFEAILWSESKKKNPQYHYKTRIKLLQKLLENSLTSALIEEKLLEDDFFSYYQDGTLFHGEIFQGIQQVINLNSQKMIAKCLLKKIEPSKQGQFPVQTYNPYTSDLLFQCLLIWVKRIHNLASLPLQVNQIKQYEMLPFDREFWIRLDIQPSHESKVIANAIVYDKNEKIYLEADQMQVTQSSRLNDFFRQNTVLSPS